MNKNFRYLTVFFAAMIVAGCGRGTQPLRVVPLPLSQATTETGIREEQSPLMGPQRPLESREYYQYYVTWLGMNVATAVLTVADRQFYRDQPVYKIQLDVKTRSIFSLLCKVNGSLISYIRPDNYRPVFHMTDFYINKKHVVKKIVYDQEKNIAYTEDKKGSHQTDISPDTLEPLGVLYYFRLNTFLDSEDSVSMQVNGGKKNFSISVQKTKERLIRVPAGKFPAVQLEVADHSASQFDSMINTHGAMKVWFSHDARPIPLIIIFDVPVGTAQAVLERMELPSIDAVKTI